MLASLRGLGRRLAAVGLGFVDAFLRDNKVLPPILALLALLVFAWVVAGTYVGGADEGRISNQANVAQSQNARGSDPAAPEIENRNVDSYAAYRNKDPFRQLLAAAGNTSGAPTDGTTDGTTQPPDDGGAQNGTGSANDDQDSDNDGLSDDREAALAQDPQNPDTDGDGIRDGADDADGDGQPDGTAAGGGASASPGAGSSPDASASPDAGTDDDTGGDTGGDDTGGDDVGGAGREPGAGGASAGAGDDARGGGAGRGGSGPGGRGDGRDRPGRGDDLLDSGGSLLVR